MDEKFYFSVVVVVAPAEIFSTPQCTYTHQRERDKGRRKRVTHRTRATAKIVWKNVKENFFIFPLPFNDKSRKGVKSLESNFKGRIFFHFRKTFLSLSIFWEPKLFFRIRRRRSRRLKG
jgi:hypothetical protein